MFGSLLTVVALVAVAGLSIALYLLPVLVGWARGAPDIGAVAVIDVLLGWTFIGWVVALAMALRSVKPAVPMVQVMQNPPPAAPPQGQLPSAGWAGPPGPPRSRRASPPPLVLPPRRAGWGSQAEQD
jgi:T4 superinfection immunity protein